MRFLNSSVVDDMGRGPKTPLRPSSLAESPFLRSIRGPMERFAPVPPLTPSDAPVERFGFQ